MPTPAQIAIMLETIEEPTLAELEARVAALEAQIAAEQNPETIRQLQVILVAILKAILGMPVTE